MSLGVRDDKRRVIPRWRDSSTTLQVGELGPLKAIGSPIQLDHSDFEASLREWGEEQTPGIAFDILAGAMALNRFHEARPAAELILGIPTASPFSQSLAKAVLDQINPRQAPVIQSEPEFSQAMARIQIAAIKRALIDYPMNPLLWADLARAYVLIGQLEPSLRAMRRAVEAAPNNRFVLRSAARLYIHSKDSDRALAILDRSPATLRDPWLLAAQLATSEVAEKATQNVKSARVMLASSSFSELQLSELSSALGSMELAAGNQKQGKKLIKQSLGTPTENAVAQAVWLARRIKTIDVQTNVQSVQRSYEAQARLAYLRGSWKDSLDAFIKWGQDEPFSSRPATFGSYLACTLLENPGLSEEISDFGLRANPNHPILLNNKAVALAYQGKVEEAIKVFNSISQPKDGPFLNTTLLATEGLLYYRSGKPEAGKALYLKALDAAAGDRTLKAMAVLHLLKEELYAKAEGTPELLLEAERACSEVSDPGVLALLGRFKAMPPSNR